MAFTSWSDLYTTFKNALASQGAAHMLEAGYTTANGQTVTFKRYEDIIKYEEFLKGKSDSESNSGTGGRRRVTTTVGYGGAS